MTVDAGGVLHVVYASHHDEAGVVEYANNAGGVWASENVGTDSSETVGIAVDAGGTKHIVFVGDDGRGRFLAYVTDFGAGWLQVEVPEGEECAEASIAVSASAIHIPCNGASQVLYLRRDLPDGIDQNCDGAVGVDGDADGHASLLTGGDDCDDADDGVHPGAAEIAGDGTDQDCDGADPAA